MTATVVEPTTTSLFYQHMKTADSAAIEAIEAARGARADFSDKAQALAEEFGGDSAVTVSMLGELAMRGVIASQMPTDGGRWTTNKHVRGVPEGKQAYRPYDNSEAAARMRALSVGRAKVPGLPAVFDTDANARGDLFLLSPRLFVHDGVAYMALRTTPAREQKNVLPGAQWEECLASELEAAEAEGKRTASA